MKQYKGYVIKPIGVVQSDVKVSKEMPIRGVKAKILIFPEFKDGLDGIDGSSHIIVMGWLHNAARDLLKVRPRKIDPNLPEKGVFALRSPVRPNPIALCSTKLLKREANVLTVKPLDLVDGTPVVDIKPYSKGWDCIFSARATGDTLIFEHLSLEETYQSMLREAANFHGEVCVGLAIGVRAYYAAMKHLGTNLRDKNIKVVCKTRGCIADAIQALTSATNKRFMRTVAEDIIIFADTKKGISVKLVIIPKKLRRIEEVLAISDDNLFKSIEFGKADVEIVPR